mgnify:CR=1 FL=1
MNFQNSNSLKIKDVEDAFEKIRHWSRTGDEKEKALGLFLEATNNFNMKDLIEKKGLPIEIFISEDTVPDLVSFLSKFAPLKKSILLKKETIIFSWFDIKSLSHRDFSPDAFKRLFQ